MQPTDNKASQLSKLALVAVVTLVGCTDAPLLVEDLGQRQSAIVNGTTDSSRTAVGVLHSGNKSACTATLVGQRTVLTAAHCVLDSTGALYQPVNFYVGGFPYGTKYAASSVIAHPAYTGGNKSDIAVVRLSQAVQGVQPMPVAKTAPALGENVVLVGYGKTGEDSGAFGTKRQAPNVVGKVSSTVISFYGTSGSQGNLCDGDSGGPTFASRGGQEVMIGVHSTKAVACGVEGSDMRIDAFYNWIVAEAQGDVVTGGSADQAPPQIRIMKPSVGDVVGTIFNVEVKAFDDTAVSRVALFLDGDQVAEKQQKPYNFQLQNAALGDRTLEAVAFDQAGNSASDVATITVQDLGGPPPPPPPGAEPTDAQKAWSGSPSPGTFGAGCAVNSDCNSGLCALDAVTNQRFCTSQCELTAQNGCPGDSVCQPTGEIAVCAPLHDGDDAPGSAGCSVGGSSADSGLWLVLGLGLLLGISRRRR